MPSALEIAIKQIESARAYTLELIQDVDDLDWFTIPNGAVSHVGWQVGHLAMAEYGLTLLRVRDRQQSDNDLIAKDFIRAFKKGSIPKSGPDNYPTVNEILATLQRVHEQALAEMPTYTEAQLAEPLPAPTAGYSNKLGSLLFCAAHEMLHAGQIGTLRRMMDKQPLR